MLRSEAIHLKFVPVKPCANPLKNWIKFFVQPSFPFGTGLAYHNDKDH